MARTPPILNGLNASAAVDPLLDKPGFFPATFVKELAHGRPSMPPQSPPPIIDPIMTTSGSSIGGGGHMNANGGHLSPGFQIPIVKNDPLSPSQRMNILNSPTGQQQHLRQQKSIEDEKSELMTYPWFVQQMERVQAEQALKNSTQGTFMIRESVRTGGEGPQQLSTTLLNTRIRKLTKTNALKHALSNTRSQTHALKHALKHTLSNIRSQTRSQTHAFKHTLSNTHFQTHTFKHRTQHTMITK